MVPLLGVAANNSLDTVVEPRVLVTSISGLAPVTVMLSASPPTLRLTSTRAANPVVSRMSDCTSVVNPDNS